MIFNIIKTLIFVYKQKLNANSVRWANNYWFLCDEEDNITTKERKQLLACGWVAVEGWIHDLKGEYLIHPDRTMGYVVKYKNKYTGRGDCSYAYYSINYDGETRGDRIL